MENAGLVTYREVALLLDPQTASLAQKKRVAEVVTHELAHQWFGNWVTMTWWDDLWLNEAFATWMAFKIVDEWNPAWRVWLEFDQGKAAAMHLDALRSTHPVRAEIRNVAEAGEAFDLITYEKGGAVLRMIEGYLGEERFRDGIRAYMRRHAKGNAVADDLWRALGEASREPVVELANAWIGAPGYPVVEVARAGRVLRLAQRRFFSEPGAASDETVWPVPLVLRYGDGDRVSEQRVLLRERTAEVRLAGEGEPDFVFANAGATGFYRVAHDRGGPRRPRPRAPAARARSERIALLSDEWALVRAGARDVGSFLDLCAGFGGEDDHAVLDELVGRLALVEHRLVADADRAALAAFVSALLGPQLAATGWDAGAGRAGRAPPAPRRRGARARARRARPERRRGGAGAPRSLARGRARARSSRTSTTSAVTLAARTGDGARFDAFRALFREGDRPRLPPPLAARPRVVRGPGARRARDRARVRRRGPAPGHGVVRRDAPREPDRARAVLGAPPRRTGTRSTAGCAPRRCSCAGWSRRWARSSSGGTSRRRRPSSRRTPSRRPARRPPRRSSGCARTWRSASGPSAPSAPGSPRGALSGPPARRAARRRRRGVADGRPPVSNVPSAGAYSG